MTDSNGKPIKQITEAAAGKDKYYIIHYRDGGMLQKQKIAFIV
jgi:hypothetical protein